jgi:hypothetical protein
MRDKKRKKGDETQFTTIIGGKTSLGPSYFGFVFLISFPVTHLMPYNGETGHSHPPNRLTLPIKKNMR